MHSKALGAVLFSILLILGLLCSSVVVLAQDNDTADENGEEDVEEEIDDLRDILGSGAFLNDMAAVYFILGIACLIAGLVLFVAPIPGARLISAGFFIAVLFSWGMAVFLAFVYSRIFG